MATQQGDPPKPAPPLTLAQRLMGEAAIRTGLRQGNLQMLRSGKMALGPEESSRVMREFKAKNP